METLENVSNFVIKDEPNNICKEEKYIDDSIDDNIEKVIVVMSSTETKPLSSKKNFDNDDDDDDDDKENVAVKRIPDEPKVSCGNREVNKIFPQQQQRTRTNRSPRLKSTGTPTLLYIDGNGLADAAAVKRRIPRPANAFMLFANEWRKKFAAENPRESNKDISVRLGIFWKSMSKDVKEKYFALAREVDREHKRKYPDRQSLLIYLNVHDARYAAIAHDRLSHPFEDRPMLRIMRTITEK